MVNKKGNIMVETFLVVIVLMVFAIVSISVYKAFDDLNQDIQGDTEMDETAKAQYSNLYSRYPSGFDGIFAVVMGLLWISVIITSFMIDSHPAFFMISLIVLVVFLLVAGYLANSWNDFADDPNIVDYSEHFPITNYVLNHLMHFIFVIGASILLALYGKNKMGGGY
jgi:uncharacterized membrane protein